jgi:uncharacterized membrane protein YqhA
MISSAEEAVDFQKKSFALNQFLSKLSNSNHSSSVSDIEHEESGKRNVGQKVVVSVINFFNSLLHWVIDRYSMLLFTLSHLQT